MVQTVVMGTEIGEAAGNRMGIARQDANRVKGMAAKHKIGRE
jgi:hypothetical protein